MLVLGVGGVDPEQIAGTVCGEGERKVIGAGLRAVFRVIRIRGGISGHSVRRQVDDKGFAACCFSLLKSFLIVSCQHKSVR